MPDFKCINVAGKMHAVPVDPSIAVGAAAKLRQDRTELRAMLEGNVAFHDDPRATPTIPAPTAVEVAYSAQTPMGPRPPWTEYERVEAPTATEPTPATPDTDARSRFKSGAPGWYSLNWRGHPTLVFVSGLPRTLVTSAGRRHGASSIDRARDWHNRLLSSAASDWAGPFKDQPSLP